MPNIDITVNERIKKRREELNMTQVELARRLGYKSKSSINLIEVNKRDIPRAKIVEIAKVLKTTPSYLMGWSDVNNDEKHFAMKVGERIKAMRIAKGYSLKEFADKVSIDPQTLENMEDGVDRLFDVELMYKFATALGVGTCYFINDEIFPHVSVASNIVELCKINFLSIDDFLDDIGIIKKTFNNYINSDRTVPFSIIEKTCKYFNISYNTFFCNDLTNIASNQDLRLEIRIHFISKQWISEFKDYDFTQTEIKELIDYAKYLVSKRK